MSRIFLGICEFPVGVGFDHGVEGGEEFSHAGGDGFFERFSGGGEALVEGLDGGVAAECGEGGHVKCGADVSASSPDGALSFELSAVVVEGCESGECGDLFAIELSEFGEVGEEREGGDVSDAGDGGEDVGLLLPIGVFADES